MLTTNYQYKAQQMIKSRVKMIKSRVKIKHFSIVGLMSPGWVRTHSDFCWTRGLGLGLWPTGLGLGLGLGLWSNGLGLTPDGLGLWPDGLGLGLWPCGLGLTAGLTSPDSLQHWQSLKFVFFCYKRITLASSVQKKLSKPDLNMILKSIHNILFDLLLTVVQVSSTLINI